MNIRSTFLIWTAFVVSMTCEANQPTLEGKYVNMQFQYNTGGDDYYRYSEINLKESGICEYLTGAKIVRSIGDTLTDESGGALWYVGQFEENGNEVRISLRLSKVHKISSPDSFIVLNLLQESNILRAVEGNLIYRKASR